MPTQEEQTGSVLLNILLTLKLKKRWIMNNGFILSRFSAVESLGTK